MKPQTLDDIFNDDDLGLLNTKPTNSPARNEDEKLVSSFEDINIFFEKNNREPEQERSVQERQLFARLKALRENPKKAEILKNYDRFGLLVSELKTINSLDDILDDDILGLLDDDSEGLFDLKHVKVIDERASTDFVARRKPCKDFDQFEQSLKDVQKDLASGKRKLVEFKMGNLRENTFYVHNGVLFLLKEINISKKDHYRADGTRVRADGRTRCIFENGTESNMLKRSVEKLLYANGKTVSENADRVANTFKEKFSNINENDQESGYIYILKSKSEKPEIKAIQNLYKIGFSTVEVEERIKNASQEPTYLMADVRIIMTFKCFNMNTHKLEQLLHTFFGKACLSIDIFDKNGNRHTPREWFIAPLNIIEQAIELIISGNIIHYRYDSENEEILKR